MGGLYVRDIEPGWLQLTHAVALMTGLPAALDGLRIVQLSDIHARTDGGGPNLDSVVNAVTDVQPDLVVFTGDAVTGSWQPAQEVAAALAALQPELGVYAVLGNHDMWNDPTRITGTLEDAGIAVLRDAAVAVSRGGTPLWLVGLDDPGYSAYTGSTLEEFVPLWWNRREALEDLLATLPPTDKRILLLHNPDLNELMEGLRLDLALCGHTHGGQVRLPLLGAAFLPSCMGGKYVGGYAAGPASPVYVNRGLGTTGISARLNCRPEITVLELRPADGRGV